MEEIEQVVQDWIQSQGCMKSPKKTLVPKLRKLADSLPDLCVVGEACKTFAVRCEGKQRLIAVASEVHSDGTISMMMFVMDERNGVTIGAKHTPKHGVQITGSTENTFANLRHFLLTGEEVR